MKQTVEEVAREAAEESYTRSIGNITESKEPIDAAYDMLCWCIENGYVKVGKEE